MKSLIVSAPYGYTLHKCLRDGDEVKLEPSLPLSLDGLLVFTGENFEEADLDMSVKELFRPGSFFATKAIKHGWKTA